MKKPNDLLITHVFDASPEIVFDAWIDPVHLQHWYAPDGCTIEFKSINAKEGGSFHSCIHDPVHGDCWIKGAYQEIVPPEKLVFSMELCDADGQPLNAAQAGKDDEWPSTIITTVTFEPLGMQTKVTLHQSVAEDAAKKTGAYQSWFSMFDRLSSLLKARD